jgi:hypothetical protein
MSIKFHEFFEIEEGVLAIAPIRFPGFPLELALNSTEKLVKLMDVPVLK